LFRLFERRAPGLYHNTVAILDTGGKLAGIYRKMHIPTIRSITRSSTSRRAIWGLRVSQLISAGSARWFVGTSGIPKAHG